MVREQGTMNVRMDIQIVLPVVQEERLTKVRTEETISPTQWWCKTDENALKVRAKNTHYSGTCKNEYLKELAKKTTDSLVRAVHHDHP